jgi:pimeloyl-ACP methyl ester carboxylesterase
MPNPDQQIDIAGYALHMQIQGSGSPVVIFEAGLGNTSTIWDTVQPAASQLTRTLAYDRAGLGTSDRSSRPRTIPVMVDELATLLRRAQIPPPYVLVGHSLGGFIARTFAYRYADRVVGLILVDPAHEDMQHRMARLRTPEQWERFQQAAHAFYATAPAGVRAEWEHFASNADGMRGVPWLPDLPTIIITSARFDERDREGGVMPEDRVLWVELHRAWLQDVPGATHITTATSGHYIQKDEPELVIDAIKTVVEQCRRNQR